MNASCDLDRLFWVIIESPSAQVIVDSQIISGISWNNWVDSISKACRYLHVVTICAMYGLMSSSVTDVTCTLRL